MKKPIVAYEGFPGAYSHLAAIACFPKAEHKGFITFDDGVAAVRRGDATYAFVPVENSTAGRVGYAHLLFGGNIAVTAEHFQPIQHCLIGIKGAKRASIKKVFSHREALTQCVKYVRKLGAEASPFADTAGAVRHIVAEGRTDFAAIASAQASKQYKNAVILEKNVQDEPDNVTRFLIMTRKPVHRTTSKNMLTSLVFRTKDVPASLFKALSGFATTGTNIIKLESFVPMSSHKDALFYLEFEGNPQVYPYSLALEELSFFSRSVEILGTYPKSSYRKKLHKRHK